MLFSFCFSSLYKREETRWKLIESFVLEYFLFNILLLLYTIDVCIYNTMYIMYKKKSISTKQFRERPYGNEHIE